MNLLSQLSPEERETLPYLAGGTDESDIVAWISTAIFQATMALPEARTCSDCLKDHPPMMMPDFANLAEGRLTHCPVAIGTCFGCGRIMTAETDPGLGDEEHKAADVARLARVA